MAAARSGDFYRWTATGVLRIDREDFLANYWAPEPGEHVTVLGPTGSGKTWLTFQLLQVAADPDRQALVLVIKPRDTTVDRFRKEAGYRLTRTWPPLLTSKLIADRPPGWVLWPKHTFDPDRDDLTLYDQCRSAILDSYKRGDRHLFVDEAAGLVRLGLERDLSTVWERGRSMGCSVWAGSQRPRAIPLLAYSQAEHLFLARDPDAANRDRFAEIGGVDTGLVKGTVMLLGKHEWLYIRRTGPTLCVVGA